MTMIESKIAVLTALRGAEISTHEYRVLVTLLTYANRSGRGAYPGVPRLASDCRMNVKTVKSALAQLHSQGFIERAQKGGGRGRATVWDVNLPPAPSQKTARPADPFSGQKQARLTPETGPFDSHKPARQTAPHQGKSEGKEREGCAHEPDEPVDVEIVPEPGNELSPIDFSIEKTTGVIEAEIVERPESGTEPPEFCTTHMPDGTGERCGGCKTARLHHERWARRNRDRLLDNLFGGQHSAPPIRSAGNCNLCDESGWRLDHGGRDGDRPKKCDHDPQSTPEIHPADRGAL